MNTYPVKIDLHMHSLFSDGTDSPEQLLECVKKAGIGFFSLTDHDSAEGNIRVKAALKDGDPAFVPGVELSCKDEDGKYHILGYNFDTDKGAVCDLVAECHNRRLKKTAGRIEMLKTEFGFEFPEEEVKALMALNNPGKPHIGNLMVKYGFVETKEDGIRNYLDKLHVKSAYIRPEEAIEAINASGGIPVLAHPAYGSGDQLIMGEEMEERLNKLLGFGLKGMECFYSGFTSKITQSMLELAEKNDLYVTAGSDYHGTNKLVVLGDNNLADANDAPDGVKKFIDKILG